MQHREIQCSAVLPCSDLQSTERRNCYWAENLGTIINSGFTLLNKDEDEDEDGIPKVPQLRVKYCFQFSEC